ncbi:GAF domain-containing protein [Magnetospirillum sp. SS-4]|uniref:GAF domain-containing protein n=1 Tax=Magnetospirillum sp. SS-4 TaxID=2681465 RepID=UPI001381FD13|nr:GAF domain-containing protein [Magnetospirillum sp. SS-4]CAA7624948.1 conserved hypothetical protein [Magnetospirillum sp. SS-4]
MGRSALALISASSSRPAPSRMDRAVAWLSDPARRLHRMLCSMQGLSALRHVSLSVHDPVTDMLWAFSCSTDDGHPPEVQEIDMNNAPSLVLLAGSHEPRVISDLTEFGEESRFHTPGARKSGNRSCMTVPLHYDGAFLGFVIFGATVPNFFGPTVQGVLETYSEAFAILICRALEEAAV